MVKQNCPRGWGIVQLSQVTPVRKSNGITEEGNNIFLVAYIPEHRKNKESM